MKATFILVTLVISYSLSAQDSTLQSLTLKITNGKSKQWTLENTKYFLGDTCANGIRLTVSLKPKVIREQNCVNGQWLTTIYGWEISKPEDSVIPQLLLYDKNRKIVEIYKVQFVVKDNSNYLRLRKSTSQIEETVDLYFK